MFLLLVRCIRCISLFCCFVSLLFYGCCSLRASVDRSRFRRVTTPPLVLPLRKTENPRWANKNPRKPKVEFLSNCRWFPTFPEKFYFFLKNPNFFQKYLFFSHKLKMSNFPLNFTKNTTLFH